MLTLWRSSFGYCAIVRCPIQGQAARWFIRRYGNRENAQRARAPSLGTSLNFPAW
jgi:hypothetical protein